MQNHLLVKVALLLWGMGHAAQGFAIPQEPVQTVPDVSSMSDEPLAVAGPMANKAMTESDLVLPRPLAATSDVNPADGGGAPHIIITTTRYTTYT